MRLLPPRVRAVELMLSVLVVAGALLAPALAEAGVVTATVVPVERNGVEGSVTLTAAPGERNTLTLRADGVDFLVTDSSASLMAGPGCGVESANTVRCWGAGLVPGVVYLGDGDDGFTDDRPPGQPWLDVQGGAGDDVLLGGIGRDHFTGGPGADVLSGGAGDDSFTDGDADVQPSPDRYDGGEGNDSLSFDGRRRALRADLAAGVTGDGDVLTDIDGVTGGEADDVLAGTDGPNSIWGAGGNDVIVGRTGDDDLHGGPGADGLDGGEGNDSVEGGSGPDHLGGGGGADRLDPSLTGRETRGEDQNPPRPQPPARDRVDCGAGPDTVAFPELIDVLAGDCELLTGLTRPRLVRFEVPLHPSRAPSTNALVYVVRMFSDMSLMPVRLEVLNSRGRTIGSSRRVRLRALRPDENGRPIRVRLQPGVFIRRPAVGWRVRVRAWHRRSASVLTLPTRP